MSHLVVVTFDNEGDAARALEALRSAANGGRLRLDDTAVIAKDADGSVKVKNELDRGVKLGALGGGALGLLLGFMFPLAGLAIGAAGGALVGKLADMGIDGKFVDEVKDSLQPGSSALFVLIGDGEADVAVAALEPFTGTLRHTSLPPGIEESLRSALR
ncbi:MAG TPA: DUF1269 domain-containing protein [Chloroflexaceae bacterium]|nr:DUF1269 domain-containing protein [Chloroflexaceae bacterium]